MLGISSAASISFTPYRLTTTSSESGSAITYTNDWSTGFLFTVTVPVLGSSTSCQRLTRLACFSRHFAFQKNFCEWIGRYLKEQEAQLSLRDRAMRRVSWNLANCHATVQKLLVRQVLDKSKLWSWRVTMGAMCNKRVHSTMTRSSRFHCPIGVINKPTTDELWISPVYRRLAVAKFSKSTM